MALEFPPFGPLICLAVLTDVAEQQACAGLVDD